MCACWTSARAGGSEERHLAFNRQPLRSRAAIVAAGPAANLLLAVLLYALVNWVGWRSRAPCWLRRRRLGGGAGGVARW
jgi:membrane-associated protease RseP (regulator of RpoE activity)